MKTFKATVDCIIIDKYHKVVGSQAFEVEVLGNSRGEAIISALDVGQALARSANNSKGERAIYFRVTNIAEIGIA